MGKLLAVISREFGERVRSRWFVITTLFAPVLFAALFIGPPYLAFKSSRTVDLSTLRIIDATTPAMGDGVALELAGGLTGTGKRPDIVTVTPDRLTSVVDSLREAVRTNAVSGLVVLAPATQQSGDFKLILSSSAPLATGDRVRAAVGKEVLRSRIAEAGIDLDMAQRIAQSKATATIERVSRDGRSSTSQVNLIFGAGVAVLLYMVILLYGQIVLRGVTEEKQSRVSEIVLASVSPKVLLSGKVLGIGGVALVQLSVWTTSVVLLLMNRGRLLGALGVTSTNLQMPTVAPLDLIPLLAYFLLGYVLYAALFATVGSIVSSEQEAQQAQTPVLMLLVGSMALLQPALQDPDGPIARFMSLMPFSSPILMPLRLGLGSVPTEQVTVSICILALTAVGAMLLAGRMYRTALLMHGKRPSLAEIARWIRRND
ncbi:MAG: ABC transporter permease [Gemmatimonadaceae bacterium]|nr:ABC transporter permease [Gemmatimonadaceae bacterium]